MPLKSLPSFLQSLLGGFVILLSLFAVVENSKSPWFLLVYLLYALYCLFVKQVQWRTFWLIEFFSSLPILPMLLGPWIEKYSGPMDRIFVFVILLIISFLIRIILLQKWTKQTRLHNLSMLLVIVFFLYGLEISMAKPEVGDYFQVHNVGVNLVVDKALFWAPKDFRNNILQEIPDLLYADDLKSDPEVYGIYFFGGSSTKGTDLEDQSDAYPFVIRRELKERFPDKKFGVVNAGVVAYTTFHIRRMIELYIDDIATDLFVLYIGFNDSKRTYGPYTYKQAYELQYGDGEKSPGLIGRIQKAFSHFHTYNALVKYSARFKGEALRDTPLDFTGYAVSVDEMIENLTAIMELCKSRGIKIAICNEAHNIPNLPPETIGRMQTVEQFTKDNGIPLLNVHEKIHTIPNYPELFLDNVHPTKQGHKLIGEMILDFLIENNLLRR